MRLLACLPQLAAFCLCLCKSAPACARIQANAPDKEGFFLVSNACMHSFSPFFRKQICIHAFGAGLRVVLLDRTRLCLYNYLSKLGWRIIGSYVRRPCDCFESWLEITFFICKFIINFQGEKTKSNPVCCIEALVL